MHIHPPKPVHGWRAFFGEVGIVVLGILIALGLEQLVETAHWREKVAQATAAVRSDLASYALLSAEQQVAGPCIDRQLDLLETALTAAGDYHPAQLYIDGSLIPFTVREPSRSWDSGAWRAVVSEGVSSHFDPDTRENFENIYETLETVRTYALQADTASWRLRSLSKPIFAGAAERARLVEEIEEQRGRQSGMTLIAGQLLGNIVEVGMLPPQRDIDRYLAKSGTVAFCREHHLPLGTVRPTPT